MKYAVIQNIYNDGGPSDTYSSPGPGWFDHKVVKVCDTKEQAEKYCEEKFHWFSCGVQEVAE